MRYRLLGLCMAIAVGVGSMLSALPADAQATLTLTKKRDMRFGSYASDVDGGGTVVIPPSSDTTTVTGPLVPMGGTIRRARFQIVGEPRAFVIVTLPSSITIRKGTSNNFMTVDTFTIDKLNPIKLSGQGKKTINIGATVHFDTNQTKGNYNDENNFTVNVEYQ